MPNVSTCPKCEKEITVPDGASHDETEVRCPLCEEEYALSEVFSQMPPALIVVRGAESDLESSLGAADEIGLMDEGAGDSPFEADSETEGAGFSFGDDTGGGDAVVFDSGGGSASTVAAPTPTKKKNRKKIGFVGQMTGIVVFGVIGIVLGFVILYFVDRGKAIKLSNDMGMTWLSDAISGKPSTPEPSPDDSSKNKGNSSTGNGSTDKRDDELAPIWPGVQDPTNPANLAPAAGGGGLVNDTPAKKDNPKEPTPPGAAGIKIKAAAYKRNSVDDLRAKLSAAQKANSDPNSKFNPLFLTLCDLGQHLALVGDSSSEEVSQLRDDAQALVASALQSESRKKAAIDNGYRWIYSGLREKKFPNKPGVLVLGVVKKIGSVESGFAMVIEVYGKPGKDDVIPIDQVTILTDQRPRLTIGNTAAVLGMIVSNPGESIEGYEPDDTKVVYGGVAFKLKK